MLGHGGQVAPPAAGAIFGTRIVWRDISAAGGPPRFPTRTREFPVMPGPITPAVVVAGGRGVPGSGPGLRNLKSGPVRRVADLPWAIGDKTRRINSPEFKIRLLGGTMPSCSALP